MSERLDELFGRMRALENAIEVEIELQRAAFKYEMVKGRVVFSDEERRQHASYRQGILSYLATSSPLVLLTSPIIYSVFIPLVLLDVFVTLYQTICFPIYGIEKARRSDFLTFDRKHLTYLNAIERFNSMYGSYSNGLLSYAFDVAGKSEKYWCPIKHARRMQGVHAHYSDFVEYGDAEGFYRMKNKIDDTRE